MALGYGRRWHRVGEGDGGGTSQIFYGGFTIRTLLITWENEFGTLKIDRYRSCFVGDVFGFLPFFCWGCFR